MRGKRRHGQCHRDQQRLAKVLHDFLLQKGIGGAGDPYRSTRAPQGFKGSPQVVKVIRAQ